MNELIQLPNIGKTLAQKLVLAGISSEKELKAIGAEKAIIKISTIENDGVCINMLYALEGAIQGIRWHNLDKTRMKELYEFFKLMPKHTKHEKIR